MSSISRSPLKPIEWGHRCQHPLYEKWNRAKIIGCSPEWRQSFEQFLEDMGKQPSKDHILARCDRSKPFSKENVRWRHKHGQLLDRSRKLGTASQYRGVTYQRDRQKWFAVVRWKGKPIRLGGFATEKEAAIAYNRTAIQYLGKNAILNEVEP
jgi:AP2 domain